MEISQPEDLGLYLRDIVEENVDQKYYLSDKFCEFLERHKARHEDKGTGFAYKPKTGDDKASTLRANGSLCPTDNIIL